MASLVAATCSRDSLSRPLRDRTYRVGPYQPQSYLQINMMIYMLTDGRNSNVSLAFDIRIVFEKVFEANIDFLLFFRRRDTRNVNVCATASLRACRSCSHAGRLPRVLPLSMRESHTNCIQNNICCAIFLLLRSEKAAKKREHQRRLRS